MAEETSGGGAPPVAAEEVAEADAVQRVFEVLLEIDLRGGATGTRLCPLACPRPRSPCRSLECHSALSPPPVLAPERSHTCDRAWMRATRRSATVAVMCQQLSAGADELVMDRTFQTLARVLSARAADFDKDPTLVELVLTELRGKVRPRHRLTRHRVRPPCCPHRRPFGGMGPPRDLVHARSRVRLRSPARGSKNC